MKKGIELSVNFIVMLIIGIVVFGFGLKFLADFISSLHIVQDDVNEQVQKEIEKVLRDPSKKITLPFAATKVKLGEIAQFGLGIKNQLGKAENFAVKIEVDEAYTKEEACDICGNDKAAGCEKPCHDTDNPVIDLDKWTNFDLLGEKKDIKIKNGEIRTIPIHIQPPSSAKKGTYIFNVYVFRELGDGVGSFDMNYKDSADTYAPLEKIILTVG